MKLYMYTLIFFLLFVPDSPLHSQPTSTIEIGTFNIRFFPCNQDSQMMRDYNIIMRYPPEGGPTDTTMLFDILRDLDIEVLAVQEIVDPPLFAEMAKRHLGDNFEFIYAPSNAWQKIGILYDKTEVKLIGEPVIYWELALEKPDRHRPALGAYFKTIPDGFDFHVIVVHLKASPRGLPERQKQWTYLEKILERLPGEEPQDKDIILLGDFNNVSQEGFEEFLPTIKNINYTWIGANDSTYTTSYWMPDWQKQELERSAIDQIFISDDAGEEYIKASVKIGGICTEGRNWIRGEFPDYYENISDHCPVFVSFHRMPDND